METYYGQVKSPNDAIILFEACRHGSLPRVQRRLSEKERQQIRSGSVFVWDEREAGMRRWTDGKSWSASRVSGSFLTYREMEGKRGGGSFGSPSMSNPQPQEQDEADLFGALDGYRYKPDGLVKQSFSITTSIGQRLHLISYFARSHPASMNLSYPSSDQNLRHIRPPKGMYPDASVHDAQSMPAVTHSPMAASPNEYPNGPNYLRHPPPQFGWPPSPVTPGNMTAAWPGGYFPHPFQPPPQQNAASVPWLNPAWVAQQVQLFNQNAQHQSAQQHQQYNQQHNPGPTAFDRAPPPMRTSGGPLPPPAPAQPYPQHQPQTQPSGPNHTPFISPVKVGEQPPPYQTNNTSHSYQQQYQSWAEKQGQQQPQYPTPSTGSLNGVQSAHQQNGHAPHSAMYQTPQQVSSPRQSHPHRSATAPSLHPQPSLPSQDMAPSKHQSIPGINALIDPKSAPLPKSPSHYPYPSQTAPASKMPTIYPRPPEIKARAPDSKESGGPQPGYGTDMNALRRLDRAFAP